ncbi:TetR/AcrR family transcriptional regulator [Lentzea sp. NEAU-D7]|uniref:TetR/AcrR family transcriptional regulator n=1 Tax=Lentzea sp. NEAU-D7 TaxID=2994667 RepID=UPI00224A5B9B|nr:TetR/AcrR family transcriptional regulator [Lentzea sp. NEAU-D7]MCX2951566.1 helix-turn-helix domain containing protein [Lentzea sp. NEAU-D7]
MSRIVGASAELLGQRGYRRVTVEEIASRAGVSKSSVYLHWNTKDEIFYDALDREFTVLACTVVEHVKRDPAEVLAHRMAVNLLRIFVDRPLLQALLIDDRVVLGSLQPAKSPILCSRTDAIGEFASRYITALQLNGLLCPEVDPCIVREATWEMLRGMTLSAVSCSADKRELERAVTVTVRRAFEPPGVPTQAQVTAAAGVVLDDFDELVQPEQNVVRWVAR